MLSLTNFLNCRQDSNGPAGCRGGPAALERATHAAQKPCRNKQPVCHKSGWTSV